MPFEDVPVWETVRKGGLTPDVMELYEQFASCSKQQRDHWKQTTPFTQEYKSEKNTFLKSRGFEVNWETGQISYLPDFKPIELNYEICYVRHGRTHGNTEPRIFQGYVDYWNNQLNDIGLKQAEDAADKMDKMISDKIYSPDILFASPLRRAIKTGDAFAKRHPELKTVIFDGLSEQRFGAWDNIEIRVFSPTDFCHLFYLEQNGLVKSPYPHLKGPDATKIEGENFVELLQRQYNTMMELNKHPEIVALARDLKRKPNILIYGHSMAGAAMSFHLGHGKKVEGQTYLGFDGPYIMKNATPTVLPPRKPE